jgi:hypothetical protein
MTGGEEPGATEPGTVGEPPADDAGGSVEVRFAEPQPATRAVAAVATPRRMGERFID